MELTRAYLEAVRACTPEDCGDCILKPTTNRACHMVDVDPRDEAALALSLMDERDRLREALNLALDRCRCNGMGVVLTETELGETGEGPCPHCADIRKLMEAPK